MVTMLERSLNGIFSILCLTTDPIHQGHEKRNPWCQHVHRATRPRIYTIDKVWEAVTSRCLGNGKSDATCKQYGGVSASYKQCSVSAFYKEYVSDECTYNIKSRQKHYMLSLLHGACLKLLVFFCQHLSIEQLFFVSMCFVFKPRNAEPAQNSRLTFLFCWKGICANIHGERQAIGVVVWCDCVTSKWFRRILQVRYRKQK